MPKAAGPCLVALLALSAGVANAAPAGSVPGYRLDVWLDADGLPQNTITGLAQDDLGFLWISTFGGLARFDGRSFERFDLTHGLRSPRAIDVGRDTTGRILVGLQDRGLQLASEGRVVALPEPMDVDRADVDDLVTSGGRLWIRRADTVLVWTSTAWRARAVEVAALAPDDEGGLWISSDFILRHVTPSSLEKTFEHPTHERILSVASGPGGEPWYVTAGGLHRLHEGKLETVSSVDSNAKTGSGPLFDHRGGVWYAVGERLFRRPLLEEDEETLELELPGPSTELFEDRERNLWVGTAGAGLLRLTPHAFERIHIEGASGPVVPVRDGLAFGGPCDSYFVRSLAGAVERRTIDGCVSTMAYAPQLDTLFVCANVLEVRGHGGGARLFTLPSPRGCSAIIWDGSGRLWVAMREGGLLTFDPEAGTFTPVDVATRGRISALARDRDGRIWVGEEGRITVVDSATGSVVREIASTDGVPPGQVRAIHFDEAGVFVGTYGGGLALLGSGGAHHYDRNSGLLDNFVSFVAADGRGYVWVSGNRGAQRILRSAFDEVATGTQTELGATAIRIGESEGGPSPRGWFDGSHLWLPTIHGVVRLDVDAIEPNQTPPLAVIRSATVDGLSLESRGVTTVPPGAGELRVVFAAATLRAPELATFEYRLSGVDDAWRRLSDRRDIVYDGLAPGSYTFSLRAINEDRVVGPAVTRAFVLEPGLLQTTWFRGSIAMLALFAAWFSHRWRTRSINERNTALSREIDRRREAQVALRDREMHYRRVFEASVNGFFVIDGERRIVDVNPAACEMFAYTAEELDGRSVAEIVGAEASSSEAPAVQVCRRKDGSTFEARVREATYPLANADRTLVTVVDLSPLMEAQAKEQRLRDQLLHSQRVDAMGRLAGGIAHDVNNMLTAVQCHAELALEEIDDRDAVAEDLLEIRAGVQRTTKLTKQLLAFGQRQTAQATVVDLIALVRSMMPMMSRLSRDDVDLVLDVAEGTGHVLVDPTHLEQIVLNLVINAAQAMPEGGRITIRVDELDPAAASAAYPDRTIAGAVVRLSVEDEGIGMPPEVLERVFEPFFTTKESQESSGLGLSVVHGIVSQARGHVVVTSAVGAGTRFDILLPRSDPAVAASTQDVLEGELGGGRGERLLYCDDDDAARKATARILRKAGYDVRVAHGPEQALEHAREMRGIDLLVTDVVMPKMNGRQLYEQLLAGAPALRVLYLSGYSADVLSDLGEAESFLPKPYSPNALLVRVRALLDESQGHGSPPPSSSSYP